MDINEKDCNYIAPPIDMRQYNSNTTPYSKYAPLPDMSCTGPIIAPTHTFSGNRSFSIVVNKESIAPSLRMAYTCGAPCSVATLYDQGISYPGPEEQNQRIVSQNGNLLRTVNCGNGDVFQILNRGSSSVLLQYNLLDSLEPIPSFTPSFCFNRPHPIYDLQFAHLNNDRYFLGRSRNFVDIGRLSGNKLHIIGPTYRKGDQETITSACLNTEYSLYYLQTNKIANAHLYDCESGSVIWSEKIPNILDDQIHKFQWCSAAFANQSFCGILANRTSLYLSDFRVSHLNDLFHIPQWTHNVRPDFLCNILPLPDRPYLFCVLYDQLLLLDERYSKVPVLAWNHMMLDTPQRAVTFKHNSQDYFIMSSFREKKLCMVELRNFCVEQLSSSQNFSASLVKHVDLFSPMENLANHNDMWFSHSVSQRFKSNLNGLDVFKKSNSSDVIVLLSNAYGDLFSYNFTSNESHLEEHRCDGEILLKMKRWECNVIRASERIEAVAPRFDLTCNLYRVLNDRKLGNPVRTALKGNNWNVAQVVKLARSRRTIKKTKISWSDILLDEYRSINKFAIKGEYQFGKVNVNRKYFSEEMGDLMDDVRLKECSDSLAKKILKNWSFEEASMNSLILYDENNASSLHFIDTFRALPFSTKISSLIGVKKYYKGLSHRNFYYRNSSESSQNPPSPSSADIADTSAVSSCRKISGATLAELKKILIEKERSKMALRITASGKFVPLTQEPAISVDSASDCKQTSKMPVANSTFISEFVSSASKPKIPLRDLSSASISLISAQNVTKENSTLKIANRSSLQKGISDVSSTQAMQNYSQTVVSVIKKNAQFADKKRCKGF